MPQTTFIGTDLNAAGVDWITFPRARAIQALAAENGPLQLSLFDERLGRDQRHLASSGSRDLTEASRFRRGEKLDL